MNKDPKAYLHLMLDSFRKIREYTANMSYENFSTDEKTQSAVIMQLAVIGELSKKVPEDIKVAIPIPWKDMAGMRDFVAHEYFKLDLSTVWHTITESVVSAEKAILEYTKSAV
jgi:uncharacterized protein with HEPN domain